MSYQFHYPNVQRYILEAFRQTAAQQPQLTGIPVRPRLPEPEERTERQIILVTGGGGEQYSGVQRTSTLSAHLYATSALEADELAGAVEDALKAIRGVLGLTIDARTMTPAIQVPEPTDAVHHRLIVITGLIQRGYRDKADYPLPALSF